MPIKSVSPVSLQLVLYLNTTSNRISLDVFFSIKRSTKAITVSEVRAHTRLLAFPAAAPLFEIRPRRPRWDETRPGGDLLTSSPLCVCVWLRPPLKKAAVKTSRAAFGYKGKVMNCVCVCPLGGALAEVMSSRWGVSLCRTPSRIRLTL